MKLSEAVRKGASLRPHGHLSLYPIVDGQICSCALGGALEAVTGKAPEAVSVHFATVPGEGNYNQLNEHFPELEKVKVKDPVSGDNEIYLLRAIMKLNDSLNLTREQIADYVEGLGY